MARKHGFHAAVGCRLGISRQIHGVSGWLCGKSVAFLRETWYISFCIRGAKRTGTAAALPRGLPGAAVCRGGCGRREAVPGRAGKKAGNMVGKDGQMAKSTTKNITEGPIALQIIEFALPLMFGNVFQMLYNTADSIVVGNFVGTEALAAVGATTMITYMAIFFFNGFATGAGVVIANYFGGKNFERLHDAIETTMAATLAACLIFTLAGTLGAGVMLRLMATPDDVLGDAETYLRIYFLGVTGLLIYNMGAGILRAVGDTTRPLYFLILTSLLNIFLDILFVISFHMGIAGVAWATILSQFISSAMVLLVLLRTKDVYRFSFRDMRIDWGILRKIFAIGLPAGIQSIITSFSNVFVQSYINYFGSVVIAGWTCYNKLDQFIMLPMQSMAMASTTFVSQNVGARKMRRADEGTWTCIRITLAITLVVAALLWVFSPQATRLFSADPEVIAAGVRFLKAIVFFTAFNCVNQVLAGSLRGRGDSRGPMILMLLGFVAVRQTYLFLVTRFFINTPVSVGFGYPVGWMATCVMEVLYFRHQRKKRLAAERGAGGI
ncbi:MATE family efflux transporter [Clostridium vitabionis]|uniref:MATE family efflux transporter n=1 Tax=Clostridium vitabionis TaxID=2784388 RepID=UPI001F21E3A2|nr:MATE family efflux transporter [Clostridium vitabionis]